MAKAKKLTPIIEHVGAPEWMTTFADMMSLLLTFFILLYSTAKVESAKVFELNKSFDKYFDVDTEFYGYSAQHVKLEKLPQVLAELGSPETKTSDLGRSLEKKDAEVIDRYASLSREETHHRIIIQGQVLFEPGSDRIAEEAKPSLLRVAARLHRYQNRIKILGHASPLPLPPGSPFADHDELGYRRARVVGRFLSGVDEDLVTLAQRLIPNGTDRVSADIFSVNPERFIYATQGYHSPLSSGKMWENPQRSDRVELVFLPEFLDAAKPKP